MPLIQKIEQDRDADADYGDNDAGDPCDSLDLRAFDIFLSGVVLQCAIYLCLHIFHIGRLHLASRGVQGVLQFVEPCQRLLCGVESFDHPWFREDE